MAAQRRSRLDPDTALEISLNGTAGRLAGDGADAVDAVAELRQLANGRTDLLAKAAGNKIGGYLGSAMGNPLSLQAAYLLILAGAGHDHAGLVVSADRTRRNIGGSTYSL